MQTELDIVRASLKRMTAELKEQLEEAKKAQANPKK
jgi:hypothetical protein